MPRRSVSHHLAGPEACRRLHFTWTSSTRVRQWRTDALKCDGRRFQVVEDLLFPVTYSTCSYRHRQERPRTVSQDAVSACQPGRTASIPEPTHMHNPEVSEWFGLETSAAGNCR